MVSAVHDCVRHGISQSITLEMLANHVGLSKYHFARRYRIASGLTPMADVRSMRLEYVRDLLLTTHLPVKSIAAMAGFSDEAVLYRHFRQRLGITPRQLRQRARPGGY